MEAWGWALSKIINESFYKWAFGHELLSLIGSLLLMPAKVFCMVKWNFLNGADLEYFTPEAEFDFTKSSWNWRYWDFVDFAFSNNYYVIVPLLIFIAQTLLRCILWDLWWEANANPLQKMHAFGLGGVGRIGDFLLYSPFYTHTLTKLKTFPPCFEPFLYSRHIG